MSPERSRRWLASQRPCVVALLIMGLGAVSGEAQNPLPRDPARGFLDVPILTGLEIFDECVTPLLLDEPEPDRIRDTRCEVVESLPLGRVNSQEMWMLAYRRAASLRYDARVDTLEIDELVLAGRQSDPPRAKVIWHLTRDREYELLRRPESHPVGGRLLVSYFVCWNGTGGCAEEFLVGDGGGWNVVNQVYLAELGEFLPQGWNFHKGRDIDLRSLEGVQPLARPGDANCCPSGLMRFEVELTGNALGLVSARAEVPAPPDPN